MPIDILELSRHGDSDYASLTEIEKAWYHVFDFPAIYETVSVSERAVHVSPY
jgi:hypothetical protein